MFYFLSKTLDFFLLPLSWFFLLLLYALFTKRRTRQKRALWSAFLLLYLCSNSFLVNFAMLWWEQPPKPWAALPHNNAVGVVLSGVINPMKSPKDRVYLNKGADRVLHTLELYKRGYINRILITGNFTRLSGEVFSEAAQLKHLLVLSGVPASAISIEEQARNTHENAVYAAQWLRENAAKQPVILVTSAFHMRRSVACFTHENVEVIPFPTDFYTRDAEFHPMLLLPSQSALATCSVLLHEIAGYLIYKIVGYA